MPWSVSWRVTIDGRDVSSPMRPFLISIHVVDRDGTASDSASLVFDDTDGQCLLPDTGASIAVSLNGTPVFEGVVDSTPWELSRGGGRRLTVTAKGFDTRGKAKEGQRWHLDDATLGDALQRAGRAAGYEVLVDPALAQLRRDYWSPDGASFLAWGQSLARQMGATFKLRGTRAVFAKRGAGASANGAAMPSVAATVGRNVISVSLDPSKGRRRFSKARIRSFDRPSASWRVTDVEIAPGDGEATNVRRFTAADEDEAKVLGEGRKADAEREGGDGTVVILMAPEAQAEGKLTLTGARPGIDGTYRIVGVTHKADRGGGSQTSLEIAQPQGEAGKDRRTPVPTPRPGAVPVPTPAPR